MKRKVTYFRKLVASRLKWLRESQRETQEEFAKRVGLSQVSLSRYELGTNRIPVVEAERLAALFRQPEGWLDEDAFTLAHLETEVAEWVLKPESKSYIEEAYKNYKKR